MMNAAGDCHTVRIHNSRVILGSILWRLCRAAGGSYNATAENSVCGHQRSLSVNCPEIMLLYSHMGSLGLSPEILPGGWQEKLQSMSGATSGDICIITYIPSLRGSSGTCSDLSECLNAAFISLSVCRSRSGYSHSAHCPPGPTPLHLCVCVVCGL